MRGEKKEEYHRGYLRRAREWRGATPPVGGTYFSNFVAVGPAHSGLSFSPSLSLGIVSAGGIMGCEDGVEGFVRQVLQMELAWLSRGRERARWSAEFLSITARDHLLPMVTSAS